MFAKSKVYQEVHKKKVANTSYIASYDIISGSWLNRELLDFAKLTGWVGSHVLYTGDHVYSDLAVSQIGNYICS